MLNRRLNAGTTLVLLFTLLLASSEVRAQELQDTPVIPTDHGAAVQSLIYARSFTLETPFRYDFNADRPEVAAGTIIVLEVDPELVKPRQVHAPVLYVGESPAMIINQGYTTGRLIAIVPSSVDLATAPVFFGSVELPERVTAERGKAERVAAEAMGIVPFRPEVIANRVEQSGGILATSDLDYLMLELAELVFRYCPDEIDLAVALSMTIGG
ncbi:MAG: hypothetical protein AAF488_01715 [Planctomycetota bacterium]